MELVRSKIDRTLLTGKLLEGEREQVLAIAVQLAQPEVSHENRMEWATQICLVLTGKTLSFPEFPAVDHKIFLTEHPPPVL